MTIAVGQTMDSSMAYSIIASTSSNLFTMVGNHGFRAGDCVTFGPDPDQNGFVGGSNIAVNTLYYIISDGLADNAFKVSTTRGGSAFAVSPDLGASTGYVSAGTIERHIASTLDAGIDADDLTMVVANGSSFPAAPFMVAIQGPLTGTTTERWERVKVTAVSLNTPSGNKATWTIERAQEGTIAGPHSAARWVWPRSHAQLAHSMAPFDSFEKSLRPTLTTTDAINHATTNAAGYNTLRTLSTSANADDILDVTDHGMSAGDRFVFMSKTGGSNIRLGQTYHVLASGLGASAFQFTDESFSTVAVDFGSDITAGQIRCFTIGGTRKLSAPTTRYPRIFGWMFNWGNGGPFGPCNLGGNPLSLAHHTAVEDRGAQSMVHMMPVGDAWETAGRCDFVGGGSGVSHASITAGHWDTRLTAFASQIADAAVTRKVIIRLSYEFESRYMPWGADPSVNTMAVAIGNTKASWIAAWKKIRTVVRAGAGASKVGFFWCTVGAPGVVSTSVTKLRTMYPGNASVDYVGFDFYVWGYEVQSKTLSSTSPTIRTNNGSQGVGFGSGQSDVALNDTLQFLESPGGSGASRPRADGSIYRVSTTPVKINSGELRFQLVKVRDGTTNTAVSPPTAVTWTGSLTAGVTIRHAPKAKGDLATQVNIMRGVTGQTPSTSVPIMIGEMGYFGKTVRTSSPSSRGTGILYDPDTATTSVDPMSWRGDVIDATADVAETLAASDTDDDLATFRRDWIHQALDVMASYSDFSAVAYFDICMPVASRHPDWRIVAEPTALAKWGSKLRAVRLRGAVS